MDIEALQTTLRTFAVERDWQPFHTPKNLSTALIVEAAELAEIFQWMTPEQSLAAHADAVLREQIADEVADVLLYLLQIADHTRVDLKRAVGRKLVKNAKKHPPVRTGVPAGTAATAGVETHVLVDWENVQPKEDDLRALVSDVTDVWLFHGPNQKVDQAQLGSFGSRATPVKIARSAKNALDFHLSFYMGYIASRHPDARFVVVSNDKGYGPMLEHAGELGFSARQVGFGPPRKTTKRGPVFSLAPVKPAVVKTPAAKQIPAAKKVAVKSSAAAKSAAAAETGKPKAEAKKAVKKAAIPLKVATGKPPSKAAPAAGSANSNSGKKIKGLAHVAASLKKTESKPARQAGLLAMIKSLLATTSEDPAIHSVLSQLIAGGKVSIDEKGAVQYSL